MAGGWGSAWGPRPSGSGPLPLKAVQFRAVMRDIAQIDAITYAVVVYYETGVFKNTDRPGTEWINGGTGYGEYLGSSTATTASGGGN